jgi:Protein of unknown function (DUF2442)
MALILPNVGISCASSTRTGLESHPLGMTISPTLVHFDDHSMWVDLSDGRTLGVPLAWFPRLLRATPQQRVELSSFGLRWEDLDEDISVASLLAGRADMTARHRPKVN